MPLTTLDETPELDLTVDGADEFDPPCGSMKGGGGALLREKIVAFASARMIVITDASKQVERLGRFPLPVEVTPFGREATRRAVGAALAVGGLRGRDRRCATARRRTPFVTDGGNYIFDCRLRRHSGSGGAGERARCACPASSSTVCSWGSPTPSSSPARAGVEVIGSPERGGNDLKQADIASKSDLARAILKRR